MIEAYQTFSIGFARDARKAADKVEAAKGGLAAALTRAFVAVLAANPDLSAKGASALIGKLALRKGEEAADWGKSLGAMRSHNVAYFSDNVNRAAVIAAIPEGAHLSAEAFAQAVTLHADKLNVRTAYDAARKAAKDGDTSSAGKAEAVAAASLAAEAGTLADTAPVSPLLAAHTAAALAFAAFMKAAREAGADGFDLAYTFAETVAADVNAWNDEQAEPAPLALAA